MTIPTKYFHDRLILLLLSVNVFLTFLTTIFILLRLSANHGNGYFVQYRADVGISAFKTGSVTELLSFIIFAFLVLAAHTVLSVRSYHIHRQLAVITLGLGSLLLILAFIVSNALLVLR